MTVALPPEILDEILDHIPTNRDGRQTLRACALVATWWTGPSQSRLFASVTIYESNYERWMKGVVLPGSKARLLGYVRSFHHYRGLSFGTQYRMQDPQQSSGEYFPALPNLSSLMFFNTKVEDIGEEGLHSLFSSFRETLTSLSLDTFATSFSAFVALVGYFPNLRILQLRNLAFTPSEGPVPTLFRPFQGTLCIYAQSDYLEFFSWFAKLDLEYEELVIKSSYRTAGTRFLENVFQISPGTVKCLRLTAELDRE